jgi:NADH-ubiquinone oxidoreductase chain 5
VNGSQDLRYFGELAKQFPVVLSCLNLANLSLCGIPFLAGFFSKDLIVEFIAQNSWSVFIVFLTYVSLGLTVYYSLRLSLLTFISIFNTGSFTCLADNDYYILCPILCLTTVSLLTGRFMLDFIMFAELVFLETVLKTLTLSIIILVVIISFSTLCLTTNIKFNQIFHFLGSILFLPYIRGQIFS